MSSLLDRKRQQLADDLAELSDLPSSEDDIWRTVLASNIAEHRQTIERMQSNIAMAAKGLTLADDSGARWAILLGEPSNPGHFRFSIFNEGGFLRHQTYTTLEDAAVAAADAGFYQPDPGALERVSATIEWAHKSEIAAVFQRLNEGQLSWGDAHRAVDGINSRYGLDPETRVATKWPEREPTPAAAEDILSRYTTGVTPEFTPAAKPAQAEASPSRFAPEACAHGPGR